MDQPTESCLDAIVQGVAGCDPIGPHVVGDGVEERIAERSRACVEIRSGQIVRPRDVHVEPRFGCEASYTCCDVVRRVRKTMIDVCDHKRPHFETRQDVEQAKGIGSAGYRHDARGISRQHVEARDRVAHALERVEPGPGELGA
jgi:hypothetical protein